MCVCFHVNESVLLLHRSMLRINTHIRHTSTNWSPSPLSLSGLNKCSSEYVLVWPTFAWLVSGRKTYIRRWFSFNAGGDLFAEQNPAAPSDGLQQQELSLGKCPQFTSRVDICLRFLLIISCNIRSMLRVFSLLDLACVSSKWVFNTWRKWALWIYIHLNGAGGTCYGNSIV